jgi:hypothetical protein
MQVCSRAVAALTLGCMWVSIQPSRAVSELYAKAYSPRGLYAEQEQRSRWAACGTYERLCCM